MVKAKIGKSMSMEVPNFILYLLTLPGGEKKWGGVGGGEVRGMYRKMDDGVGVERK